MSFPEKNCDHFFGPLQLMLNLNTKYIFSAKTYMAKSFRELNNIISMIAAILRGAGVSVRISKRRQQ